MIDNVSSVITVSFTSVSILTMHHANSVILVEKYHLKEIVHSGEVELDAKLCHTHHSFHRSVEKYRPMVTCLPTISPF